MRCGPACAGSLAFFQLILGLAPRLYAFACFAGYVLYGYAVSQAVPCGTSLSIFFVSQIFNELTSQ